MAPLGSVGAQLPVHSAELGLGDDGGKAVSTRTGSALSLASVPQIRISVIQSTQKLRYSWAVEL